MTDEDIEALQLLAGFQLAEEQIEAAIASLQQLTALQPENPEYHNNLGFAWLQTGNLDAAIASLQTALRLNPYATESIDELLHQLTQEEQFDTVITLAIHALQVNPTWDQGFLYIGNALQQQGADSDLSKACVTGLLPVTLIEKACPNVALASVSATSSHPSVSYIPIDPGGVVNLITPKTANESIHPNFVNRQIQILPSYVVSLCEGRVWADAYTRAIFTSEGALIEDASTGNAALVASSNQLPAPNSFQGTLASLTIRDSHNYFHWMYDLLPKLELLEKSAISINMLDAVLVNQCRYPFQRELLNLMGISDEKILDTSVYHAVANRLIVPISSPLFSTGRIAKRSCDFLRQKLLPETTIAQSSELTRLYISRQSATYRTIQNEVEVVAHLQRFGFEKILLETLTVQEQITLFANAEAIIAPHGAGLANLVFCKPGTKVIELFLPDEVLDYYWIISQYMDLDYYYLITDATEPVVQQVKHDQRVVRYAAMTNMMIRLEQLSETLRFVGII